MRTTLLMGASSGDEDGVEMAVSMEKPSGHFSPHPNAVFPAPILRTRWRGRFRGFRQSYRGFRSRGLYRRRGGAEGRRGDDIIGWRGQGGPPPMAVGPASPLVLPGVLDASAHEIIVLRYMGDEPHSYRYSPELDGELLLLMGAAAAVMKMAVEMAAVSMEKPSGALPRPAACRNRDPSPDLKAKMARLEGDEVLPPDVMIWLGEGAPSVFRPAVAVGSSDDPASGSVVAIDLVAMLDGATQLIGDVKSIPTENLVKGKQPASLVGMAPVPAQRVTPSLKPWTKPPAGWIKLSIDGSYSSGEFAGVGTVVGI
ncbi:hypothetical protein QYE76_051542 [Lolium multiflorum]|uniref:Uncharacterized protein n=1 Tax=Lolium multiflorum TaxID=4521 RepID=A0AAD8WK82_LOLMU|nr:hypothetical protein QYE76_051542 [Lolium multiflorum]